MPIQPKPLPSREALLALLRYDERTGKLFWRHRPTVRALDSNSNGYRRGRLWGEYYYAHRVIWKMLHGTEPPEVDHRRLRVDIFLSCG